MPSSTIKDSVTIGKNKFEYAEVKSGNSGGGPRGIRIWLGTRDQTYGINPNPHDSKKYNNNGQAAFYKAAATSLGTYYNANDSKFPRYSTTEFLYDGITYTNDAPH